MRVQAFFHTIYSIQNQTSKIKEHSFEIQENLFERHNDIPPLLFFFRRRHELFINHELKPMKIYIYILNQR